MVEIIKVDTKNLKEFIGFPYKLYEGDPFWTGELKMDVKKSLTKNPFWKHAEKQFFIARKDGKTAGRVAAVVNDTHNEVWGEKTGFFGFFDCVDDGAVADGLFTAAREWLKEKGMTRVLGPFNPSINHACGLLVDDYSTPPFIMMPYNYPYYEKLVTGAGFVKAKDLLAFERDKNDKFSPRFEKIIRRVIGRQDIKMRPLDMKNFDADVLLIKDIYNKSWAQNWGALPISSEEILDLGRQIKMILDPEITCVAEVDGVPAGFYISIPDMNRVLKVLNGGLKNPAKIFKALTVWRKLKSVRLIMLGVLPEYRKRGLDLLLVKHIVENGVKAGYDMAELSWLLEDNRDIISIVKECGCREVKRRYRIFEGVL